MAIKPLGERLDELSSAELEVQEIAQSQPGEPLPEPIEYETEPAAFEPVQVAGKVSATKEILKAVRNAGKKTERPIIDPKKEIDQVGPYQVVPEATAQKAEEVLSQTQQMPASGVPSPTPAQVEAGVPKTTFNLDQIKGEPEFKQFVESVAKTYGADDIFKISYKGVAAKAAEDGYDEAFIANIMSAGKVTQADPREAYKMMLALTDADKRAFDLGERVKQAQQSGTLTPDLATEFQQAVALAGNLSKAVKGRQADIARTLGIFSQARSASVTRGAQLDAIMAEAGGMSNAYDLAVKFTALDSRGARVSVAEKSLGGTLKDVWFSTWINGLLSHPVTHAKNVMGNMFFGSIQIPERAIASIIGKGRNRLLPGGEAAIEGSEVYAQAIGMIQGMRDGFVIGGRAFAKNEPTDAFTKIEMMRRGADPFDFNLGDSETGQALSKAINYYGKFVTLPGRALMAEDEFFKAMGYRMELNALATRAASGEYRRLIQSGIDSDEAARLSAEHGARILADPPADIDEAAKSFSRTITFTRELEKSLQGAQQVLQNPLMKIFVPFVRTPTNIVLEAAARVPGLNVASPRFWADWNAGGVRRDMAVARVTLGTGIMAATGSVALEGKITGYGPMRKGDKEAMKGTGWQEFSLVFNRADMDDELLANYKKMTSVVEGSDGKVYISYAGLEPIGTLLGIAATAGEYSMMNAGEADMQDIMIGGGLGVYQYLSEMPMLQGLSDIMKVFTSGAKDAPAMFYNIVSQVTEQGMQFLIGGSPLGVHSSFVAGVDRIMNPDAKNVLEARDEVEMDIASGPRRGFWEAVNRAASRNPLTSDLIPPRLDSLTGEKESRGKGNMYEMFLPFRKSDGKISPVHSVMVEYGIPQFEPPKKIDGIELTADQVNTLIEIATDNGALADRVVRFAESPEIVRLAASNLSQAQTLIQGVISDAYSIAKQRMLTPGNVYYDEDLAEKIRELKELQAAEGKFRR
jgi:hypothetical protein